MSETEPLLNDDGFENLRERTQLKQLSVVGAVMLIVFVGLVIVWGFVIPFYIQRAIDNGEGSYVLHKLQVKEIGNKKIHFVINAALEIAQDQNQLPVTAEMAENKLDIQLRGNQDEYKTILILGTPRFYYSTTTPNNTLKSSTIYSNNNLSFSDKISFKNIELISTLISDFATNSSKRYSIGFRTHPKVSIPGIPGSWTLNFFQTFDFNATSDFLYNC